MVTKIHLKNSKKIKKTKRRILLCSFLIVILFTFLFVHFLGKRIYPTLVDYATIKAKQIAISIINQAINDDMTSNLNKLNLFDITKNANDEIQTLDFNSSAVNQLLKEVNDLVEARLKSLEAGDVSNVSSSQNIFNDIPLTKLKKGIVCEIPLGVATGNTLLSNLGPKFPVRLSFVGNVISNINTKVNSYGINTVMIEINIHLEVTEQMLLPLISKEIPIALDVPLIIKMVQGKVPDYYQNGFMQNSPLLRSSSSSTEN